MCVCVCVYVRKYFYVMLYDIPLIPYIPQTYMKSYLSLIRLFVLVVLLDKKQETNVWYAFRLQWMKSHYHSYLVGGNILGQMSTGKKTTGLESESFECIVFIYATHVQIIHRNLTLSAITPWITNLKLFRPWKCSGAH